jgi:5'-deoxynucleotidase YfbR-like HD superfamily hydrolase
MSSKLQRATSEPAPKPLRAWQRMLSGRRLDLLDPSPLDIEIGDISHGLSRVARWNGQTRGVHAFSVAQHSALVEAAIPLLKPGAAPELRLAGLLHDAPEYVVGDLISPFKAAVGLNYKAFELRLQRAIHQRFGLPAELPQSWVARIKKADRLAAYFEATELAGFDAVEARKFFGEPAMPLSAISEMFSPLVAWETQRAQEVFIARFEALSAQLCMSGM